MRAGDDRRAELGPHRWAQSWIASLQPRPPSERRLTRRLCARSDRLV